MLKAAEIETIITNKGLVKMTTSIAATPPKSNTLGTGHVDYQYKCCNLTVGDGIITINRLSNDSGDMSYNCANVITVEDTACLGTVRVPGYIYTDNFSGCVFYIYRGTAQHAIGVHAHQGLYNIKTVKKSGFFNHKKKIINSQVRREYGPKEYMATLAKRELCRHETRGQLTDEEKTGGRNFLAFLSCVEYDHATTFLYSYSGGEEGNRVQRLVDKFVDTF